MNAAVVAVAVVALHASAIAGPIDATDGTSDVVASSDATGASDDAAGSGSDDAGETKTIDDPDRPSSATSGATDAETTPLGPDEAKGVATKRVKAATPAVVLAPDAVPPNVVGHMLARIDLNLAKITPEERAQLQRFLSDLIGKPIDEETVREAQARLGAIRRYAKVKCRAKSVLAGGGLDGYVVCDVVRARVLHDVRIVGLPVALLESDVRKRVFLKPGEPLDEDDASDNKSRLVRQRLRIEELLEREGFVGAEVRLLVKKSDQPGEYNVVIRVRGGSFVEVRNVVLKDWFVPPPLSQRELTDAFSRMCLTSEGLLDGVFVGNFTSCFNKRRLTATIEHFVARLHEAGYPEARLHVTPRYIDPTRATTADCALSALDIADYRTHGLKAPYQCVDLLVDLDAGTKVTARFHTEKDDPKRMVRTPEVGGSTLVWMRETFAEPISRQMQITFGAEPKTALDSDLVDERMTEQLTFAEAGAVDETEIEGSAKRIEEYLGQRGRIAPHVTVEDRAYHAAAVSAQGQAHAAERVVDFTAKKSRIGAIRSVRFVGNRKVKADDLEKHLELAAHTRSFGNSGMVSPEQLADDEERIRAFYAERGYAEANVQAAPVVSPQGDVDVSFFIDEGEAFVLQGVVLQGGAADLTPDVLKAIKHCEGGKATKAKKPPTTPEDCAGAPLRPDELEADTQRVQQVYAGHGYPNVEVAVDELFESGIKVRFTVSPPHATAAQREHAVTGNVQPVRLGEVFVEGNHLTQRDVILREAGLDGKADAPLDPIALGKGISRLRRSGLFNSVELQYLGLDGSFGGDHASVRLSVDERPAVTVDTSVGFSSEQLWSLRTEARHKNLFGTMLDADALLDFGLFVGRTSQAKTQLRWPRIFGTDVSLSLVPISVLYSDEPAGARLTVPSTRTGGQEAKASWEAPDLRRRLFSAGVSLALDWRLQNIDPIVDDKLALGLAIEWRNDWLNTAAERIQPFSLNDLETVDGLLTAITDPLGPTQVATLTPRVRYDDVDNPFDPKEGFGVDAFVRASSPPFVKHGPFAVVGAAGRVYTTFWDRVTLAAGGRARAGFSAPVTCPGESPCEWALMQNDLLLLGGERSVRGVDENQIGVFSAAYDANLHKVVDADGNQIHQLRQGLYGANVNVEARTTVVKQFVIGAVQWAVFADAGGTTDEFNNAVETTTTPDVAAVPDNRFAYGLGTGLRLVTPVGPAAFDVAFSPPRGSYHYYITFGYVF